MSKQERWTDAVERILFSAEEISKRVQELGAQITADYQGGAGEDPLGRPLLVIGILKGALPFMADLVRALKLPINYDFMAVSSYGNGVTSGEVRTLKDLEFPIAGRDVLIVEDIVDTGRTLQRLVGGLSAREPATLRVCALLDKPFRREVEALVHYIGFVLEPTEDVFMVGYGLDKGEDGRNLPFLAKAKQ